MDKLLEATAELAALVSPARVRAIATALRSYPNASVAPAPNALADTPAARAAVVRVVSAWAQIQASGAEVAGMLLGASAAQARLERETSVELVWTGPTTRFVPTRRTEQVLLDLIATASIDLFLVSFVAYEVRSVVAALNQAAARGVRLRVLLEAATSHGGSLTVDPAAMMRASVPAAEIFTWRDKEEPFTGGRVHAKVAVSDGARAFITSANLTDHALAKNMEAGVMLNGGYIPKTLRDHLEALVAVGVIEPA